jgi:hypothetical protein
MKFDDKIIFSDTEAVSGYSRVSGYGRVSGVYPACIRLNESPDTARIQPSVPGYSLCT